MTPTEQIKMMRDHLVDPDSGGVTPRYDNTTLLTYLNLGRNNVSRRSKCVHRTSTINTVAGTRVYAAPTTFIEMQSFLYKEDSGSNKRPLIERSSGLVEANASSGSNSPSHWYRWGADLRLDGTPSVSVSGGIELFFYGLPDAIAAGLGVPTIDIPERYHFAAVYCATGLALFVDEEPLKARDTLAMYEDEIRRVRIEDERSSRGGEYIIDSYDPVTGNTYVI